MDKQKPFPSNEAKNAADNRERPSFEENKIVSTGSADGKMKDRPQSTDTSETSTKEAAASSVEEQPKHVAWWKEEKPERSLSPQLQQLLDEADESFVERFLEAQKKAEDGTWLWTLYLDGRPLAREALKRALKEKYNLTRKLRYYSYTKTLWIVPFQYGYTRYIKAIYKLAENRRDAEVWGIIAWRFDTGQPNRGTREVPVWKENEAEADNYDWEFRTDSTYKENTHYYMRRRTWRFLRELGKAGDSDYVPMATEALLQYRDIRDNYWEKSVYDLWLFNHILHRHSKRMTNTKIKRWGYPKARYTPSKVRWEPTGHKPATVNEREEAFPELWDHAPEPLMRLLLESQDRAKESYIISFAAKTLRQSHQQYLRELPLETFLQLLHSDHPDRRAFAVEEIRARQDADNPSAELLFGLLDSQYADVIQFAAQALRHFHQKYLRELPIETFQQLLESDHSDRRAFAAAEILARQDAKNPTVDDLLAMLDSEHSEIRAKVIEYSEKGASRWKVECCHDAMAGVVGWLDKEMKEKHNASHETGKILYLTNAGRDWVAFLRPILEQIKQRDQVTIQLAQRFHVVMIEEFFLEQVPDLIRRAEESGTPFTAADLLPFFISIKKEVRDEVQRILRERFGQLQVDADFLVQWASLPGEEHRYYVVQLLSDMRFHMVPVLPEFLQTLWRRMKSPDVPEETREFLRDDLLGSVYLEEVATAPLEKVLRLFDSDDVGLQSFGGRLLEINPPHPQELSEGQMLALAHSPVAAVRRQTWGMLEEVREKQIPDLLFNLAETDWDDTRQWAVARIEALPQGQVTSELIYGLLDSAREDIQQLAMRLVREYRKHLDEVELLLRAGESPYMSVQLFALEIGEKIVWNPDRLRRMERFFRTVLFRVQKGRPLKDRTLQLLQRLGQQNREMATEVVPILGDYARNGGKGDFSRVMVILTQIRSRYPEVGSPLRIETEEAANGGLYE
ncbi:HEAT repeat domain-containing protein [Desmospora activa]|uniref:HEAT repeat protein n=1 Tax=Desmospora activa DSM 45169 TaxID=1121389 RepID=A0A2T4Z975_9BACL|nr:hypothetical protein [Desmospora activa]PTM58417.1 hypothetical protein C8J48_1000 [Desmospora activa DSM 45169]